MVSDSAFSDTLSRTAFGDRESGFILDKVSENARCLIMEYKDWGLKRLSPISLYPSACNVDFYIFAVFWAALLQIYLFCLLDWGGGGIAALGLGRYDAFFAFAF